MANIHIDLSPDGLEGQWIDMVDLGQRSTNQFIKVQGLYASGADDGARAFVAEVVAAWHIINPATGEPLPPPSSTAVDLGDMPIVAGKRFSENIQKQLEGVLPKGS